MGTDRKNSALDVYINKVYVLVLLLIPGAAECAGLVYTFSKIMGWLPTVSLITLIVFDISCLIYLAICIFFVKTGMVREEEGQSAYVLPSKLKSAKIFIIILVLIQFNFIVYMIPATDFWGFAFFFVILTAFLLDYKLVAVAAVEVAASIVASWFLYGKVHLPAKDVNFMVNMLDRVACIVLSLASIVLLTYLINRFLVNLVNAQRDALERNHGHINTVLESVRTLSEKLSTVGAAFSQVSESESVSSEELLATSEELLKSSNLLSSKTDESMVNLNELSQWENVVADNVQKVESVSKDIIDKSKENERLLDELQSVNAEVLESMTVTTDAAQKLSDAVREIGVTLNLINEISSSINLLALNASIEAARAGEAGRGFAVVATEIGDLADNTKGSLADVETVIKKVQSNVSQITFHVEKNSQKLNEQSGYLDNVFRSMRSMTQLIHMSFDAIDTMGNAHNKQANVIKNTVSINQDIAESIKNENEQFASINIMAENNASDIAELASNANAISNMVDEMKHLLKIEE